MNLSQIAYSLSKLLIAAAVTVFYSAETFAQEVCGNIGNNNETELSVYDEDRFYLDMNHTACCTGDILSWKVCYYGPEADRCGPSRSNDEYYFVKYAVYRRKNGTNYIHQVANSTFNITLIRRESDRKKRDDYDDQISTGFNCYNNP